MMNQSIEKIVIRFLGKSVLECKFLDVHHDIFFFLILILVFVSLILFRTFRATGIAHGTRILNSSFFITFLVVFQSLVVFWSAHAECMEPGNEADRNEGPSGSGTAGPSYSAMEEKVREYLEGYKGTRSTRQPVFDEAVKELQLRTSDASDRLKMLQIMENNKVKSFSSPKEAASQLILDYSKYYEKKYGKSLFV